MKRFAVIALILLLSFSACARPSSGASDPSDGAATSGEEVSIGGETTAGGADTGEGTHALDGKRFLFVGNSHTYYGRTVLEKKPTALTQEERSGDTGYFYRLCKENGAEVSVTNWTFGSHSLRDLFTTCAAGRDCDGVDHLSYLTSRTFDYVVLQEESSSVENFLSEIERITALFRAENENVKFVFLVQRRAYERDCAWLSELDALRATGVTVVDWGGLVDGIIKGEISVPNSDLTYDQNSFIIRKSASDGYHPNLLTGYITALSIYCAITGESAVGQAYDFCCDVRVDREFNLSNYIARYYTYGGATTNFDVILTSEADMRALQQLIDARVVGQAEGADGTGRGKFREFP